MGSPGMIVGEDTRTFVRVKGVTGAEKAVDPIERRPDVPARLAHRDPEGKGRAAGPKLLQRREKGKGERSRCGTTDAQAARRVDGNRGGSPPEAASLSRATRDECSRGLHAGPCNLCTTSRALIAVQKACRQHKGNDESPTITPGAPNICKRNRYGFRACCRLFRVCPYWLGCRGLSPSQRFHPNLSVSANRCPPQ
jgi:hypothetical protein